MLSPISLHQLKMTVGNMNENYKAFALIVINQEGIPFVLSASELNDLCTMSVFLQTYAQKAVNPEPVLTPIDKNASFSVVPLPPDIPPGSKPHPID